MKMKRLFNPHSTFLASLLLIFHYSSVVRAIGGAGNVPCISFDAGEFDIVSQAQIATPILTGENDWPGVHRAVQDLADDIERVAGVRPAVTNITAGPGPGNANTTDDAERVSTLILIGTLGQSVVIDALVDTGVLDVSDIEGQWETYKATTLSFNAAQIESIPGMTNMVDGSQVYVIVGSDKRGTIYGLYDHSEGMGVSPWYWWADVPVQQHDTIHASSCAAGPPTVRYRGIFLNDEQPALQNWAMDKFTNGTGSEYLNSPFNQLFYTKLFELLLRLKANYLWPAIWGSAFCIDDELNQFLADYYGIAMGTSHQEPMARSSPNEWNIFGSGPWNYTSNAENVYQYFVDGVERAKPFDTVYTMGMRGSGDLPLEDSTNIALLEKIVSDQREILTNVFDGTDVTTVPQMWCLYKEVQGYYEDGMRVPDDITLLWSDDNWGNIRRFPLAVERDRSGGAGVYYHVDYVGGPRDYKWTSSTQIPKMWEQLSMAQERNATRIWILNVGDLKPNERETEFFLTYAWNTTQWSPSNLRSFSTQWAMREFGVQESDAEVVADIVTDLTRYNARRKPELLNGTTWSLVNYREAENVVNDWNTLLESSTAIYDGLPESTKPAYFQLLHHSVVASANMNKMLVSAGVNQLRASQARVSANHLADQVEELFERDWEFEDHYHTMLDGKWNHMMDQTHLGYFYWQQPMQNTMPSVTRVMSKKIALPGPMRVTIEGNPGAWPGDNVNNCAQGYNCPPPTVTLDQYSPISNAYVDVSSGGGGLTFDFNAETNVTWLSLSASSGTISPDSPETRIYISVADWSAVPAGNTIVGIDLAADAHGALNKGQPNAGVQVLVSVMKRDGIDGSFSGFVEGGGVVSIEAAHATRNEAANGVTWTDIPGLGRTLSGVTPLPRLGNDDQPFSAGQGPMLEYSFYSFTSSSTLTNNTVNAIMYLSPALNSYGPERPLTFAASLDGGQLQTIDFIPTSAPGTEPAEWKGSDGWVANAIITVPVPFTNVDAGSHTLQIFMTEPGVVLQKVVIDLGGLLASYLGPPESVTV